MHRKSSLAAIFFFLVSTAIAAISQTGPNITSLSPSVGPVSPVGSSVTIAGSGFGSTQGSSTVSFGGIIDTPSSWSDSQIVVPVPSSLPTESANVFVTVNGVSSNTAAFLVIPVITALSPEQGIIGSSITITGTSFGAQQNNSTVTFNSTAVTPTFWSNTSITVPVPIGSGDESVVVTVNGFSTNEADFFVLPNIAALSPASGSAGALITVSGTAFGQSQGFGSVSFNGLNGTVQSWSDTSISVTAPSGVTSGGVVVTTGLFLTSNSVNFTVAGGLNTSRYGHSATLLNNGQTLVAGGINCSSANQCTYLNSAEIFDPNSSVFTSTGSMTTARSAPAVLLANGKMLIAGGYTCDSGGNCASLSSAEIYDPAAGTFSSAGNMNVSRSGHTMTVLNSGQVLIVGGETCTSASSCTALSSAEIFDPVAGIFNLSNGTLANARFGAAASLLPDGNVLIVGGTDGTNFPAASETYTPSFDFFFTSGNLAVARYQPSATLLDNGEVLVAGGSNCISPGCPVASAELYDERHDSFDSAGTMTSARSNHTATLLTNGQVVLAGGYSSCDTSCASESNVDLYDPVANTFTAGTALGTARAGHTGTLLSNGNVVFVGGISQGVTVSANDSYQPTTLAPSGLTSIAITPANRSFLAGATLQLTATGTFSGGTTQVLQAVAWSSSDNTIATVTSDASDHGLAYAVATGTVTITACAGTICGTTSLRVGPPALVGLTTTPSTGTIPAGLTQKFQATGAFSDGTSQDVSGTVAWTSTATQVASVSSIGLAAGLTTGTTTIQAASGSLSASATLTVQSPVLTTLTVQPALGGTTVGGTQAFTAMGTFTDGSTQNLTSSVTWSSSNTGVASVNTSGLGTGIGNGTASITAKFGGAAATGQLTVAAANTPPMITALASPAPNAIGWNNTSVTVTFTCSAGSAAIVSCPAQQVVASEGAAQVITGTTTDANGATASASLTLNIDKTPPGILVTAPTEGASFTNTSLQITGNVSDSLSGIATVSCDGVAVAVNSGSFSCNISLNPGVNLATVRALDLSGNTAGVNLHVSLVAPLPPPVSLAITPANVNMLVGDTRSFSAFDDQSRQRSDAMWSISDNTITALASIGSASLTGIEPGQVTLTAAIGNVTAQVTVNVLAGTALSPGTVNWSIDPFSGNVPQQVVVARPVDGAPAFYSLESSAPGNSNGIVRALTVDGQQLWSTAAPSLSGTPDSYGGILFHDPFGKKIVDLDPQTGSQVWEYDFPSNVQLDFPKIAVGQDGTIYLREGLGFDIQTFEFNGIVQWSLIALDPTTGAKTTLYTVPYSTLKLLNTCNGGQEQFLAGDAIMNDPHVASDGSVFVETMVRNEVVSSGCGGGEQINNPGVTLSVLKVQAGLPTLSPFQTITSVLSNGNDSSPVLLDIISDGQGGTLAGWGERGFANHAEYHVGHGSSDIKLPFQTQGDNVSEVDLVLGDQGFFATDTLNIAAMSLGGAQQWTWASPESTVDLQFVGATDGGGLVVKYNTGSGDIVTSFDSSGNQSTDAWDLNPDGTPDSSNLGYLGVGQWLTVPVAAPALSLTAGTSFDWPESVYAAIAPDHRDKANISLRVHQFSDSTEASSTITSEIQNGIDFWRKKAGILMQWTTPISGETPCIDMSNCWDFIPAQPEAIFNSQNMSFVQFQDPPSVPLQNSNANYFWQLTTNYRSRFPNTKGIDIFFIRGLIPTGQGSPEAIALFNAYPTFDNNTRGLHMWQAAFLDNNSQLSKGAAYVFLFNIGTLGFNPNPATVVSVLGGDSNFGSPAAYITGNDQLGVSFVYQGQGSNTVNAGTEMQNVLNNGVGLSTASLSFAGANSGAAGGDWQVSNQILYGPTTQGAMAHEIGHVFQLPHVTNNSDLMCVSHDVLVFFTACGSPGNNLTVDQLQTAKTAAGKLLD